MHSHIAISSRPHPYQPAAQQPKQADISAEKSDTSAEKPRDESQAKQVAELTPREIKQVEQLKRRDQEVKAHELAHKATAGQYARGAASYEYQTGPDGNRYAVGGEVSIDIARESDPRATLNKAQVVRRAAMAPANPSGQDRQIAMRASAMAAEAQREIQIEARATLEEARETSSERGSSSEVDHQALDSEEKKPTSLERRAIASFNSVLEASEFPQERAFERVA